MFPDSEIISPFGSCCKRKENQETLQSHCGIQIFGQAHNMFLRIFRLQIYEFVIKKYYLIFLLIFSNAQNWEKKLFLSNKEIVFFFNSEVLMDKFVFFSSKNSWKHIVSSIIVVNSWVSPVSVTSAKKKRMSWMKNKLQCSPRWSSYALDSWVVR